jgi:hypothetical protein
MRRRGRPSFRVFATIVVVVCGTLVAGASAAGTQSHSVLIGQGHIGRYQWSAHVSPAGRLQESEPGALCLDLSMLEITESSEFDVCGRWRPAIYETARAGTGARPKTAVAFLFDGSATRIYLKLAGRPGAMLPLKQLSVEELGSISTSPISSFARGYSGRFCIERYIAYQDDGHAVYDSGKRRCRGSHR